MDGSFASGLKTWLATKNNKFARDMLTGLALECPLGEVAEHCPLKEVRALSVDQRISWLNSKTDPEIEQLYSRHYACLKERE